MEKEYSQYPNNQQNPQYPQNAQFPPQPPTYPHYPPNQQAYNAPHFPPPVNVPPSRGCLKNMPQSCSVGISALIFLSGGMHLAWSLNFGSFIYGTTMHMRICWFIGAIIGALVGSFLVNQVHKKFVVLFSAVLVVVGGILFASLPHDGDAIVAARYLDGIANGLIFPLTLVMAGEEAVKKNHGILASTVEVMAFSLGAYIQIIYTTSWPYDVHNMFTGFGVTEMQGVLSIVFGGIVLLVGFLLIIESPVFFLVRGQQEKAFESLLRLQRPLVATHETYEQFEDHKRYIADNKELTIAQSAMIGLPALMKLCFYRAMVALSFSALLCYSIIISALVSAGSFVIWPYIVFGAARWLGATIAACTMDSVGRKKPLLFGFLCCAGLAIGIGVLFEDFSDINGNSKMTTAMYLLIVYEFFAGISISASSTYLSEAFPLAIKPYYIAVAFIVECVIQIIICTCTLTSNSLPDYFYAVGALSVVFFVLALYCLPETRHTSLREAQSKFNKVLSMGLS